MSGGEGMGRAVGPMLAKTAKEKVNVDIHQRVENRL